MDLLGACLADEQKVSEGHRTCQSAHQHALEHRAPSFRFTFLPMHEGRCRSPLRWSVLGHLVLVCGGLAAQQDLPFAAGAAFPTRETLLTIATETPFVQPRRVELPEQVDLSPWFPVAGDQGMRNSFTGWAVGYALRYYHEARLQPGPPVPASAGTADTFSPLFVYNCSKQYLMKGDRDQGSDLIVAMTVAVDNGVCRWSTLPYDTALTACLDSIPSGAFAEAAEHRMQPQPTPRTGHRAGMHVWSCALSSAAATCGNWRPANAYA